MSWRAPGARGGLKSTTGKKSAGPPILALNGARQAEVAAF
jgi:hypothetical protein